MIYAEALVVTCFDYRLQELLDPWIHEHLGPNNYNRVALAGAVKNWDIIFNQVELSKRFHDIQRVIFINHEDCRAYGAEGNYERHQHDLRQARERVRERFPDLKVELYHLWLDGRFEPIE